MFDDIEALWCGRASVLVGVIDWAVPWRTEEALKLNFVTADSRISGNGWTKLTCGRDGGVSDIVIPVVRMVVYLTDWKLLGIQAVYPAVRVIARR